MLPQDPYILLSYVNTQLRDNFSSLEAFCEGLNVSAADLGNILAEVGFRYDPQLNQFR